MKKSYLFFLITIFCTCSKDKFIPAEKNVTFTGLVWDYTNNQPVGNANVKVALDNSKSFDRLPTFYYTVSDAHGNFTFSLPVKDETEYKIIPSKPGYVFIDTSTSWFLKLNGASIYYDTVLLDVASILQVNFHDMNVASINDTLNLLVGFGSDSLHINPTFNHSGFISYNTSLQFFDSASYKQNCFARIQFILNNSVFHTQSDTTVKLIEFGTKTVDVYY